MRQMTCKEYARYVQKLSPKSPLLRDMCFAFLIGGAICVLAQLLQNGFSALGLDKDAAGTAASVSMIFLGALLTGLSLFDDIAKVAGAGTLVPITGFANSIVAPAMEFRSEGYVLGTSGKMFTIAGPVLVFGISASVLLGAVLWVISLF
jgi:stage V sporulation protein AC